MSQIDIWTWGHSFHIVCIRVCDIFDLKMAEHDGWIQVFSRGGGHKHFFRRKAAVLGRRAHTPVPSLQIKEKCQPGALNPLLHD